MTWQLADVAVGLPNVHGDPTKVPVPLLVKVTVPVGAVAPEGAVSVTVAVQVATWLIATLAGVHETVVEVV